MVIPREAPPRKILLLALLSSEELLGYLKIRTDNCYFKRKPAEAFAPAGVMKTLRGSSRLAYIGRLRPLWALYNFKFDRIPFLQRPVAIPDDRGIVNENIGSVFTANESVSFRIIEPLYRSLHFVSPLAGDSWGGKQQSPPRARIARSVSKRNW